LLVLKNGQPAVDKSIAWDETKTLALSEDIPVSQDDKLQLRVKVDSPIDLSKLAWAPKLFYVAVSQPAHTIDGQPRNVGDIVDGAGNYLVQLRPPYEADMYPTDDLVAPEAGWVAPADGKVTVASHLIGAPDIEKSGIVYLTAKKRGQLLADKPSQLLGKAGIAVVAGIPLNQSFTVD